MAKTNRRTRDVATANPIAVVTSDGIRATVDMIVTRGAPIPRAPQNAPKAKRLVTMDDVARVAAKSDKRSSGATRLPPALQPRAPIVVSDASPNESMQQRVARRNAERIKARGSKWMTD
jgi:hypothetical protein